MDLREQIKILLPGNTVGRNDLLPLFQRPQLFEAIVYRLSAGYYGEVDYVAAPEALGWILGAAMAARLHVGFIALRKGGKLPYREEELISDSYVDSTGQSQTLCAVRGSIPRGSRVVLVDEWIQSGAQVRAALRLLDAEEVAIAGVATIGMALNEHTRSWVDDNFVDAILIEE